LIKADRALVMTFITGYIFNQPVEINDDDLDEAFEDGIVKTPFERKIDKLWAVTQAINKNEPVGLLSEGKLLSVIHDGIEKTVAKI